MTVKHVPSKDSRKRVESYAAVGIPQEDIARVLKIDAKTLRKHYREELDTGSIKANATVGGALYNKAVSGDTTAGIWWTKARMGWRGESKLEGNEETTPENYLDKLADMLPD